MDEEQWGTGEKEDCMSLSGLPGISLCTSELVCVCRKAVCDVTNPRFSGPCLLISCCGAYEHGKREASEINVIGLPAECSHLSQSLPSHLTGGRR